MRGGVGDPLPLVATARACWDAADGHGVRAVPPAYTAAAFQLMLTSPFGTPPPIVSTLSFVVSVPPLSARFGVDEVRVHTSGRAPSHVTVRTIRATVDVLGRVYGARSRGAEPCIDVFLVDDPRPKALPQPGVPVEVHHVNSGFSVGDRVVVLRCSEMHRTLVHELLHVWGAHGHNDPAAQARATVALGAPDGCLLTEAFVEATTWLIHGGFCARGLDAGKALGVARNFLDVRDTGETNAWAYYVGKALLVADGGHAFHAAFFGTDARAPQGRRLQTSDDHRALVDLMVVAANRLGGPTLHRVPHARAAPPLMCPCSPGPAFDAAAPQRIVTGGARRHAVPERAAPKSAAHMRTKIRMHAPLDTGRLHKSVRVDQADEQNVTAFLMDPDAAPIPPIPPMKQLSTSTTPRPPENAAQDTSQKLPERSSPPAPSPSPSPPTPSPSPPSPSPRPLSPMPSQESTSHESMLDTGSTHVQQFPPADHGVSSTTVSSPHTLAQSTRTVRFADTEGDLAERIFANVPANSGVLTTTQRLNEDAAMSYSQEIIQGNVEAKTNAIATTDQLELFDMHRQEFKAFIKHYMAFVVEVESGDGLRDRVTGVTDSVKTVLPGLAAVTAVAVQDPDWFDDFQKAVVPDGARASPIADIRRLLRRRRAREKENRGAVGLDALADIYMQARWDGSRQGLQTEDGISSADRPARRLEYWMKVRFSASAVRNKLADYLAVDRKKKVAAVVEFFTMEVLWLVFTTILAKVSEVLSWTEQHDVVSYVSREVEIELTKSVEVLRDEMKKRANNRKLDRAVCCVSLAGAALSVVLLIGAPIGASALAGVATLEMAVARAVGKTGWSALAPQGMGSWGRWAMNNQALTVASQAETILEGITVVFQHTHRSQFFLAIMEDKDVVNAIAVRRKAIASNYTWVTAGGGLAPSHQILIMAACVSTLSVASLSAACAAIR